MMQPNKSGSQNYNGLGDKHLVHFFMKSRKRKDLVKNGVIDREGNITPSFVMQKHNYTPDEIKRN